MKINKLYIIFFSILFFTRIKSSDCLSTQQINEYNSIAEGQLIKTYNMFTKLNPDEQNELSNAIYSLLINSRKLIKQNENEDQNKTVKNKDALKEIYQNFSKSQNIKQKYELYKNIHALWSRTKYLFDKGEPERKIAVFKNNPELYQAAKKIYALINNKNVQEEAIHEISNYACLDMESEEYDEWFKRTTKKYNLKIAEINKEIDAIIKQYPDLAGLEK